MTSRSSPSLIQQGGKSTCFLQLDQELRNLISVSYWDAKVATMEVGDSGELAPPRFVHQTSGGEYVQNTKPGRIEHWTYRQRWRVSPHRVEHDASLARSDS